MTPKTIYKVLCKIDEYGKDLHLPNLFREELEDTFNKTMGDNLMPKSHVNTASFSQYSFTLDDNKMHFNYGAKCDVVSWGMSLD